jgi:hypothetical protein
MSLQTHRRQNLTLLNTRILHDTQQVGTRFPEQSAKQPALFSSQSDAGYDRKATSSTVMSRVRSEEVMQVLMGATHPTELPPVYGGVKQRGENSVSMDNMKAYINTHSKHQL